MGLPIEGIRSAIFGPVEELSKPSPTSIRVRESHIPGRHIIADTIERARFYALAPIKLAQAMHEEHFHPIGTTVMLVGLPLSADLLTEVSTFPNNNHLFLAVTAAMATHLAWGAFLTGGRIDDVYSRTASRIAGIFRRAPTIHSVI